MGLVPNPDSLDPPTPDTARLVERIAARAGEALLRHRSYRGQLSVWVRRDALIDLLRFLKGEPDLDFALLADITAVDLLGHQEPGEPRFEVVYNLYSIRHNRRLLLKTGVDDGQTVPSATAVWPGADFMEREVWDLMGVRFEGHPNLERLVTPEGWLGHPLRKDFPTRSDQFPNVES